MGDSLHQNPLPQHSDGHAPWFSVLIKVHSMRRRGVHALKRYTNGPGVFYEA